MVFVLNEYLAGFGSFKWPQNSSVFELVDQSAGPVVAQFEFTLQKGCRTLLALHYNARSVHKQGIAFIGAVIATTYRTTSSPEYSGRA